MWRNFFCAIGCLVMSCLAFAKSTIPYSVTSQKLETQVEVQGQWYPYAWHTLRVPVSSTLTQIHQIYGRTVDKGDLLFELESPSLELELAQAQWLCQQKRAHYLEVLAWRDSTPWQQAEQALEVARLQFELKKSQRDNTKALHLMGGVSKETLMHEELAYLRCEQQVVQAKNQLDLMAQKGDQHAQTKAELAWRKADLEYQTLHRHKDALKVYASASGILYAPDLFSKVEHSPIAVSENVEKNQCLGVIVGHHEFGVALELDAKRMELFEHAKKIRVRLPDHTMSEAVIHSSQPGQLSLDANRAVQFHVQLSLVTPPSKAPRLGQRLEVSLILESDLAYPLVPNDAIFWHQQRAMVMKKADADVWQHVPVKIGQIGLWQTQVVEGLIEGDVIGINA